MKRAAIYVRVSSDEQKKHGLSVDNQLQALQEYCTSNGYIIAGVYSDAGISARKKYTKRPALLRLMTDCGDGKIDVILFTKLDRWFRSVADYYEVQSIIDRYKVPWRAIWEDYETETSSGVFKVNIMLSVAQAESDRTSERNKAINAYRRSQGLYMGGLPPMGYIKVNKKLEFNPETYKAVKAFFQTYVNGGSITQATDAALSEGVRIGRATAKRMLRSDTYSGGNMPFVCPAYINSSEAEYIKARLAVRSRQTTTGRTYIFSGIIRCKCCGRVMSGKWCHGRNYYVCKYHENHDGCEKGARISEWNLEKYLIRELDDAIGKIRIESHTKVADKNNNEQKRKALKARLSRIGDRYEVGEITFEEYKAKRADVITEIGALDEAISSSTVPDPMPEGWVDIYNDLDQTHKKMFWQKTLHSITIKDGRPTDYTF